jgi:hypothetical protein
MFIHSSWMRTASPQAEARVNRGENNGASGRQELRAETGVWQDRKSIAHERTDLLVESESYLLAGEGRVSEKLVFVRLCSR